MWYRYFLQRQNKLFVNKYCRRFLHTVIVYRTHVTFIGNKKPLTKIKSRARFDIPLNILILIL